MRKLSFIALVVGMLSGGVNADVTSEQCASLFEQKTPSLAITANKIEHGKYLITDFAPGYPGSLDEWHQCASAGISGYLEKPVVIIPKPSPGQVQIKNGRIFTSAHTIMDELLVGRMVVDSSHPLAPFVNRSRRELETEQRWLVGIQGLTKERSVSTLFLNGCLIQYDQSQPFAQYAKTYLQDLDGRLSDADWGWIEKHGDDIELWHEIGHCSNLIPEVANYQPDANEMALPALSRSVQPGQSCSGEIQSVEWEHEGDRILWNVIQTEYQADLYALQQLGLSGDSKAWQKFRIASGIRRPQVEYMTWVGDVEEDRAQAMADSWEALNQLHSTRKVSDPEKNIWDRLREVGQVSVIVQPSLPPQEQGVAEWIMRLDL